MKGPDYECDESDLQRHSDLFRMNTLLCFGRYEDVMVFAMRFGFGFRRRDGGTVIVPNRPMCIRVKRFDQVQSLSMETTGFIEIGPYLLEDQEEREAFRMCSSRYHSFGSYLR